jgi:hypothetical protein
MDLGEHGFYGSCSCINPIVVKTPVSSPVAVVSLMKDGVTEGLHITRGGDIFDSMMSFLNTISKESQSDVMFGTTDFFALLITAYEEFDREQKKWLKSCNFRARKGDKVPFVYVNNKATGLSTLDKASDIKHMLYIVKGLLKAHDEDLLSTEIRKGDRVLTLDVSGDIREPDVKTSFEHYPESREMLDYIQANDLRFALEELEEKGYARTDKTYIVMTSGDTGDNEEEELTGRTLVVLEDQSEDVLGDVLLSLDTSEAYMELNDIFHENGVPAKVKITDPEFSEEMAGYFDGLGVEVVPETDKARIEALTEANARRFSLSTFCREFGTNCEKVADPDNLSGWMAARVLGITRCIAWFKIACGMDKELFQKSFFQYDFDGDLPGYDLKVQISAALWYIMVYQPGRKDEEDFFTFNLTELPAGARAFLENLKQASLGLYKVKSIDDELLKIVVQEIWDGSEITINHLSLAFEAKEGNYVPLWVYDCGNFKFAELAGPIFGGEEFTEVISELREKGLPEEPSRQDIHNNAHLFGSLWEKYAELDGYEGEDDDYEDDDEDGFDDIDDYEFVDEDADDDSVPELDPELKRKCVEKFMYKHYMDWLDVAIPALGGKTPREASKTPEGGRKVRDLINNMPVPSGEFPIRVPRLEMLAELGLIK